MSFRTKEQGSVVHIVIVIVLVVALLGALGFIFYQNFIKKDAVVSSNTQTSSEESTKPEPKCQAKEDEEATNGVFCSELYGVKFTVPSEFKGKLEKSDNTPIYPVSDTQPDAIGETESVVSAKVSRGQYEYSLTISLLPQINTMSLGFIAGGQFDASDKKVYSVVSSASSPGLHRGDEYTSVTAANGIKVYRDTYGDVGHMLYKSALLVGDKVVLIDLRAKPMVSDGLPSETPTVNDTEILATLKLLR